MCPRNGSSAVTGWRCTPCTVLNKLLEIMVNCKRDCGAPNIFWDFSLEGLYTILSTRYNSTGPEPRPPRNLNCATRWGTQCLWCSSKNSGKAHRSVFQRYWVVVPQVRNPVSRSVSHIMVHTMVDKNALPTPVSGAMVAPILRPCCDGLQACCCSGAPVPHSGWVTLYLTMVESLYTSQWLSHYLTWVTLRRTSLKPLPQSGWFTIPHDGSVNLYIRMVESLYLHICIIMAHARSRWSRRSIDRWSRLWYMI